MVNLSIKYLLQLFSQVEFRNQIAVTVQVDSFVIAQQASAFSDQLPQSAARIVVFGINFEVLG